MKRFLFLSGLIVLSSLVLQAQEVFQLTRVEKAVYFDKTPPLRDMKVILPGQRDRSWKNGLVEDKYQEESSRNHSFEIRENFTDPVLQAYFGKHSVRGPIRNYDGVGNVNGVYPPDTEGDVSPDYYFQMINLSFAIWDKQGNLVYGPVDNSTLWEGFIGSWTGTNDGDPVVLYDEQADRWMASQFAVNTDITGGTYWQLFAISQTNDPLGSWYRYAWQFNAMNDYPKLGVWNDAYYGTFRMFGTQVKGGVAAFERDKMLIGDPGARMVYFDLNTSTLEILPADVDGPSPPDGTTCFFTSLSINAQKMKIYGFHVDWNNTLNSTFTLLQLIDVDPFSANLSGITQPGTTQTLDDMTDRLMYRLQYRNFGSWQVLLTNHTVNVSNHAGIRWYEFRKDASNWYIYQQGTYSPDAENRWMGSIAMNGKGNIALGYSVSSSTVYPSVRYTGRTADAPLGEMNIPEMDVVDGTNSQSGVNRWGDYSMMSVDPADDSTFWYTQEYMKSQWKTRIVTFDFGPILPPSIDAGNDDTICEMNYFTTQGIATYCDGVLWSTSGDGNFIPSPPNTLSTTYLRGPDDIANGSVTLKLTGYGYEAGFESYDSLLLSIVKKPDADAGIDTTICNYHTLTLSGQAEYASSYYWTTNGDGAFSDTASLTAEYFPGTGDIAAGSVKLTLHALAIAPCSLPNTDYMKLTLDPCTGMDEKYADKIDVKVIPNPTSGVFDVYINGVGNQAFNVQVTDTQGNILFSERSNTQVASYTKKFDMTYFPKGIYLLKVRAGNSQKVEKIVVQ
ncbi:MAG: T9SS type A sorting domain-containing protein [Bacteroidetes bacterium]|nr:T9SS type A sorting domain-containing protein [Bacteroidota bacterium]